MKDPFLALDPGYCAILVTEVSIMYAYIGKRRRSGIDYGCIHRTYWLESKLRIVFLQQSTWTRELGCAR